jgi:hypothetical protein
MADRIEAGEEVIFAYVYCRLPGPEEMFFVHEGVGPGPALESALMALIKDGKQTAKRTN